MAFFAFIVAIITLLKRSKNADFLNSTR